MCTTVDPFEKIRISTHVIVVNRSVGVSQSEELIHLTQGDFLKLLIKALDARESAWISCARLAKTGL